jgi:hypothetical protein
MCNRPGDRLRHAEEVYAMAMTIHVPERVERKLTERAAKVGKPAEALALELIEQGVDREPTLAEIMAPFAREVAESGMTEAEFDALIEEAREEVWQEQQRKKKT